MTIAPESFAQWEKRIPRHALVNRDAFMLDVCRGKYVTHLGATDAPFAEDKARRGELLHQKLRSVAGRVVGLDHDRPSIDALREQFGIDDIRWADLSRDDAELPEPADVVVCGDIIEHVDSVGGLLANCNRLCRPGGSVLVSTINALALKPLLRSCRRREAVHPDHVAYFSYSTLGVALIRAGFEPADVRFFQYDAASKLGKVVFGTLYRLFPQMGDGIIVVGRKSRDLAVGG